MKPEWKPYKHLWHKLEVPARTTLLREGEVSKKIFVVKKGCARAWFNHDGKEVNFQFFFENDVISSAESFRKKIPSLYNIETVEPTDLRWIGKEGMALVKQDIALYDKILANAADRQAEFMKHFFSFLKNSPEERYANLLQEHPEILQRVPLQYVASYLGITQVSLSRIRNRLR